MKKKEMKVTIPQQRYEMLIESETRIKTLRDYIVKNTFLDSADILCILGCVKDSKDLKSRKK